MEYQPFFITQSAIIKNKKGQILILCHNSKEERWLLPGGKINKGELWSEGLQREIKEETGITEFKIESVLDVSSWLEPPIAYYVVVFLCSMLADQTINLSNEHNNYAWISPIDLDKYNFWHPDIKKRIEKVFFPVKD